MRPRYFSEKQRKNISRKEFPKKPLHTDSVRPSEAAFLASLVTTGAFLKPANSFAEKMKDAVIIRSSQKECMLGKGEFVIIDYRELHLSDEFPSAKVPARLEEHSFMKIERTERDGKKVLEKTLLSKEQFEKLKQDAKEVFRNPVDVEGAEVVQQEREAIASVACPVQEKNIDGKALSFISGAVSGMVAVIALITILTFIFKKTDLVEPKSHSQKEENKHSENNGR